jgi:hypothetical protein
MSAARRSRDAANDARSWRDQAATYAACFAKRGFDLAHPFSVDAFNEGLQERHEAAAAAHAAAAAEKGEDVPPPPPPPPFLPTVPGSGNTVALLIGNTGACFWECFLRWLADTYSGGHYSREEDDSSDSSAAAARSRRVAATSLPSDPLDAYVEAAARDAVAEASSCSSSSAVPPLDVRFSHVMRPPHRFVDVLRAAAGSGMAFFSLAAHLCAHPVAGPYFSLRCVVVLDAVEEQEEEEAAKEEEEAEAAEEGKQGEDDVRVFAADGDVERLMALSANAAAEAASAAARSSPRSSSSVAADAVAEQWLRTYGRVLPSRQRARAPATVVSAEEEARVGKMYAALFSRAAAAAAAAAEGAGEREPAASISAAAPAAAEDGDGAVTCSNSAALVRRGEAAAGRDKPWKREEAWRGWAEARAALGGDRVAPRWRFSEAQTHYHYTRDREGLRREVERVLAGRRGAAAAGGGEVRAT